MSSEMSADPESSNPFVKLSDDPILHIFSFFSGDDLLKLSEVDKNFKRIITESTETMSKIPLVLDFENNDNLDLNFAIKLAQTRRFTALKLYSVHKLTDADAKFKLGMLMKLLSGSIDDFTVWYQISQEFLSSTIAMFLPKLKKCLLHGIWFDDVAPIIEGIGPQNNVNHPLESLELSDTQASKVLQLFTGCNQLKTFCFDDPCEIGTTEDFDHVNNFLATQEHLEKLEFDSKGPAWNRLKCFKLKVLEAECLPGTDDQLAAAEFLKKLPNLAKLAITLVNHPSRSLMNVICRIPKLEELTYQSRFNEDEDEDEDSLEGLVNHNVKELRIFDYTDITPKLLKIFSGVDSVFLNLRTNKLDLSDVPCDTIMKFKLKKYFSCYDFKVKFSPSHLPTNVEQFESAVMEFATKFSEDIVGIELGHESWRNSGAFRLSNSFCEELVNRLPYLEKLEVYNIADNGKFLIFLDDNQRRLRLEDVKLYKPFGVGEPEPKKMKIQVE